MKSDSCVRERISDLAAIHEILAQYGRLSVDAGSLKPDADLYAAGLTSLATVSVMLALENHFDIEFPDSMLGRRTFASIQSIAEAVAELTK
jgi:acyl carrier protein